VLLVTQPEAALLVVEKRLADVVILDQSLMGPDTESTLKRLRAISDVQVIMVRVENTRGQSKGGCPEGSNTWVGLLIVRLCWRRSGRLCSRLTRNSSRPVFRASQAVVVQRPAFASVHAGGQR